MRKVIIFDTTLRDGEQSPGASLSGNAKFLVAKALADLGVDVIEAGFPAASIGEAEAVARIAREVRGPTMAALALAVRSALTSFNRVAFSVHCHNDLGLAVANTLAAIEAGVDQAHVTINGLGERGGNASLEETVMALRTRSDHYRADTAVKSERLVSTSRLVSDLTGIPVQPNKAVVA